MQTSGRLSRTEDSMSDRPTTNHQEDRCRDCGTRLGAGYLCDDCDTVEVWDD